MPPKSERKKAAATKPRYGIGEWYGKPFASLSPDERKQTAEIAIAHNAGKKPTPACPFQPLPGGTFRPCNKKGGVCSLKLYVPQGDGSATPASGLATVCPCRFRQDSLIFGWVGEQLVETNEPRKIGEVRFLKRIKASQSERIEGEPPRNDEDDDEGEDVGNIDNVLVHPTAQPLKWCALEVQAVYFSGRKMGELFAHIRDWKGTGIPFPDRTRRPDWRSSGPKRLMPQLQIKVPALRRWGKKMAVVIDEEFFENLSPMESVRNGKSNCDIVWFVVGFDESSNPARLFLKTSQLTTLERAVEGLTNGIPVELSTFEKRITDKLASPNPPEKQAKKRAKKAAAAVNLAIQDFPQLTTLP
jgi:hypothetical protein